MKNKISLVVTLLLLVVLLIGASFVYSKYSDKFFGDNTITVVGDTKDKTEGQTTEDDSEQLPQTKDTDSDPENEEKQDDSQETESTAPDIEVYDRDGNAVKLSDYYGKPVVLNFWATWCGPCRLEMPGFDNLYKKYKDKVNFLMVNCSEDRETVREFVDESGYSFPILYDDTGIAAYAYGASSIPRTFVFKKDGELYGYQIGVLSEEALENALVTVLEEDN